MGEEVGEDSTEALNWILCFLQSQRHRLVRDEELDFIKLVHQAGMQSEEEQGGGGKNM